jgi:hypothetical protein
MKFRLCLFALGLLLVSAVAVRADGIPPGDPFIIVGGGGASPNINSLPFTFTVPTDTAACTVNNLSGQCFDSFNNTGVTIPSLVITFPSVVSNVSCAQGALAVFSSCVASGTQVTFTGGTGIPDQTHFFIFLQDGFATGTYTATTVPEPATLGLLATGLSALFAGRKLRKRAASRT